MPLGPGKYDDACTAARVATEAETIVLIISDGKHGPGFSVQSTDPDTPRRLPALLRLVARQIEAGE